MLRDDVLWLQSKRWNKTIAVGERVCRADLSALPRNRLHERFNSTRQTTRPIDIPTKSTEPEWINCKSSERYNALKSRIEICGAKRNSIRCQTLIETTIDAD